MLKYVGHQLLHEMSSCSLTKDDVDGSVQFCTVMGVIFYFPGFSCCFHMCWRFDRLGNAIMGNKEDFEMSFLDTSYDVWLILLGWIQIFQFAVRVCCEDQAEVIGVGCIHNGHDGARRILGCSRFALVLTMELAHRLCCHWLRSSQ